MVLQGHTEDDIGGRHGEVAAAAAGDVRCDSASLLDLRCLFMSGQLCVTTRDVCLPLVYSGRHVKVLL